MSVKARKHFRLFSLLPKNGFRSVHLKVGALTALHKIIKCSIKKSIIFLIYGFDSLYPVWNEIIFHAKKTSLSQYWLSTCLKWTPAKWKLHLQIAAQSEQNRLTSEADGRARGRIGVSRCKHWPSQDWQPVMLWLAVLWSNF